MSLKRLTEELYEREVKRLSMSYNYNLSRDTQPIIPVKESDEDLRARLEYVTGQKLPREHWYGARLDVLAEQYNLKRRVQL